MTIATRPDTYCQPEGTPIDDGKAATNADLAITSAAITVDDGDSVE
ncbi:hypothetical protein MLAC_43070 [Mycobacterium lacus]|uniref:Uncharacterized protein n=1 Tax=Mycobacterium lacus TaxID=169765 RepID=A0A7I7NRZ5_9MYCO|nr:hypothetical protein MLAC_43070 [Mycobacterium lacus]